MSGFVALLGGDGAPVDRALLEELTGVLARRGPDRSGCVALGEVGLGHALLATSARAARERQPSALGPELWIAADVRLDARADLVRALEPSARCDLSDATDPELLLHAYRAWGERCVEHLLGDFAFVIWDGARRRLFCARDPFGVKLLYWARAGRGLVVGNTLACLRLHPDVSDRLDPRSIGSLLLWGDLDDRAATTFADVRALPAGHALVCEADRLEPAARRWWRLPADAPEARRVRARDVVGEYRALLDAAVADRMGDGDGPAAVLMSGGLDSPMVAAAARRARPRAALTALTVVFDRLIPDRERRFSTVAARGLGIPIRHFPADALYTSWDWMRRTRAPEPQIGPSNAPSEPAYAAAAERGRIVLTGWDGDSLLALSLGALWRGRVERAELAALTRELGWHVARGRLPRVGVRAALARRRARAPGAASADGYPRWLRPDFERAQELRARWRAAQVEPAGASDRDGRAPARRALESIVWRTLLDAMDPGMSGAPIEHRHPLLDLRLVRFALSLPPVPWCVDKQLFRAAVRDELPRAVVRRPKEPLPGDPIAAGLAAMAAPPDGAVCAELAEYVDPARHRAACAALAERPPGPLGLAAFHTAVLDGWLAGPVRAASRPAPALEAAWG